jgi:GH24 family phage-related lysozyme (muramidase)
MANNRRIGEKGLFQIKLSEGFVDKIYSDQGKPAIGYGINLTPAQAAEFQGKTITEAQATQMLRDHLKSVEDAINRQVTVDLNQNQFDALCSWVYNVGVGNFSSSTLLKKLNAGDVQGAADEFPRWNQAGGKVLAGLIARRGQERALFLSSQL